MRIKLRTQDEKRGNFSLQVLSTLLKVASSYFENYRIGFQVDQNMTSDSSAYFLEPKLRTANDDVYNFDFDKHLQSYYTRGSETIQSSARDPCDSPIEPILRKCAYVLTI